MWCKLLGPSINDEPKFSIFTFLSPESLLENQPKSLSLLPLFPPSFMNTPQEVFRQIHTYKNTTILGTNYFLTSQFCTFPMKPWAFTNWINMQRITQCSEQCFSIVFPETQCQKLIPLCKQKFCVLMYILAMVEGQNSSDKICCVNFNYMVYSLLIWTKNICFFNTTEILRVVKYYWSQLILPS